MVHGRVVDPGRYCEEYDVRRAEVSTVERGCHHWNLLIETVCHHCAG
jgi:hypothetical protein